MAAQVAVKTHLSQPIRIGAFEGQHGMSFVISSTVADIDMSSAIPAIDASEDGPAMTGRDNGANTSPAIMKVASNRRMVIWRFTPPKSHRYVRIESLPDERRCDRMASLGWIGHSLHRLASSFTLARPLVEKRKTESAAPISRGSNDRVAASPARQTLSLILWQDLPRRID